jgi:hypothetical protein
MTHTVILDHRLPDAICRVLDSHGIDAQSAGRSPDSRSGAKQYLDRRTQIDRELSVMETRLRHLGEALMADRSRSSSLKVEEERKKVSRR